MGTTPILCWIPISMPNLGIFGLARLVDHDKESETTVLVAMIALEIAYGMKPIKPKVEEHQVNIIDWVWRLYGMGNLSEAVYLRLS
uniref:Uncharacterized protein n=1 Tax=Solanum lycopersicum TaxID=4081 RepID=A0A3Q7IG53_SOLLC